MCSMKVLITGAAGYIGTHVLDHLFSTRIKASVRAMVRTEEDKKGLEKQLQKQI